MVDRNRTLVVVGASVAGASAATAARAAGWDGRIVLVGDEPGLPYERPPLSKAVLRGEKPAASTEVNPESTYAEQGIELLAGRTVEALDPAARRLVLDGGEPLAFDAAVLATGAEPRRLTVPGAELAGVHYLRTVADAEALSAAIGAGGRVVVVGAGWIGCEVAASARQMGADVVLIDPRPVPLERVLGPEMGAVFAGLHADHGVVLRLGTGVAELRGGGDRRVAEVSLTDGTTEAADLVVAGVGVLPRVGLAEAAGLPVDNGVVVDQRLRSEVPGIYAAGDVAAAWHPRYRRHLRVEHWANALHQGRTAGANAGGPAPGATYDRSPYFFSDQYDLGMEYVGLGMPDDEITVRGDVDRLAFVAFWQRDGVVTAAMHVNVWDATEGMRAIVESGLPQDPRHLVDPDIALDELAGPPDEGGDPACYAHLLDDDPTAEG
jgi:3-phenylpropionate/trans-cinnamate dioxygenase ferredoxin reductase component